MGVKSDENFTKAWGPKDESFTSVSASFISAKGKLYIRQVSAVPDPSKIQNPLGPMRH